MFQEIESIIQKDVMWVVEGGISYDDFNNGIRIRARKVELLETFRMNHVKSLHINCADTAGNSFMQLAQKLEPFKQENKARLIFHAEKEGYDYDLALNDDCMLVLEKQLGKDAFHIEYR